MLTQNLDLHVAADLAARDALAKELCLPIYINVASGQAYPVSSEDYPRLAQVFNIEHGEQDMDRVNAALLERYTTLRREATEQLRPTHYELSMDELHIQGRKLADEISKRRATMSRQQWDIDPDLVVITAQYYAVCDRTFELSPAGAPGFE